MVHVGEEHQRSKRSTGDSISNVYLRTCLVLVHGPSRPIGTANSEGDATRRKRRKLRPKLMRLSFVPIQDARHSLRVISEHRVPPVRLHTFFAIPSRRACGQTIDVAAASGVFVSSLLLLVSRCLLSYIVHQHLSPMHHPFALLPACARRSTSTLNGQVQLSSHRLDNSVSVVRLPY